MTALTANVTRKVKLGAFNQRVEDFGSAALDPSAEFFQGALCIYDTSDDLIKPAETTTTGVALGVCETYVQAGEDRQIQIRSGARPFANSAAADAIANDDAGATCYMVDDDTVALTNGSSTRSAAGKIVSVDSDGVWVAVNPYA